MSKLIKTRGYIIAIYELFRLESYHFRFSLSKRKFDFLTLFICFVQLTLLSQVPITYDQKKLILETNINDIITKTDSLTFRDNIFLNGKLHKPVLNRYFHPYLGDNMWQEGDLWYRGDKFQVKLLKYDIETDHLITLPFKTSRAYPIALDRHYVDCFLIGDRKFQYFKNIDLWLNSIEDGYLEVLYEKETSFLIKWKKEEVVDNSLQQIKYKHKEILLLWKDHQYFKIRNKPGLLYRLRDKRKELRHYIRSNQLLISKHNHSSIVRLLEYYDNLCKDE